MREELGTSILVKTKDNEPLGNLFERYDKILLEFHEFLYLFKILF